METKEAKIKKIIEILAVSLAIMLIAFAGVMLYRYYQSSKTVQEILEDNYIKEQDSEKTDGNQLNEKTGGLLMFDLMQPVYADQISTDGTTTLALYQGQSTVNTAFQEQDLYPGDTMTKKFQLTVYWKRNMNICFRATLDSSSSPALSNVMKIRIEMPDYGKVLYDGIMRDMPRAVEIPLYGGDKTETEVLNYDVTVYLDTSAGNECENATLKAHFSWWAEEGENGGGQLSPNTGLFDVIKIVLPIILILTALLLLLLLRRKRKESLDESA